MTTLSRWLVPAVLAAGLGFGAMTPAPAQAQDSLTRVLVDIADVVFNGGVPYYRYGNYGYNDRLIVSRDRYGRPVYYRQMPYGYNGNGYNNYNGYDNYNGYSRRIVYDQYGRPLYDRYGRRIHYTRYDNRRSGPPYGNAYGYYRNGPGSRDRDRNDRDDDGRWWDGRRWHDGDDD